MNDRLKSLYKSQILTRSKDDTRFFELEQATHVLEAYNPMCGDQYKLYLQLEGDIIQRASFKGYGCAISRASTDVLAERLEGRSIRDLTPLISSFQELIDPDSERPVEEISEEEALLAFAGTRDYPERKQCASLAWDELEAFIAKLE